MHRVRLMRRHDDLIRVDWDQCLVRWKNNWNCSSGVVGVGVGVGVHVHAGHFLAVGVPRGPVPQVSGGS